MKVQSETAYIELAILHDYYVTLNGGTEQLFARYEYNYRNELRERDQHYNTTAGVWLQKIDYLYNDQGWLTQINGNNLTGTNIAFPTCTTSVVNPGVTTVGQDMDQKNLFYMQLQYDNLFSGVSGTLRKDGNISQAIWRVRGRERQAYSYTYDGLQRISMANYSDINDAGTVTATNRYNTSYTYADLRGNISNNQRNGLFLSGSCYTQALLDNMTYTYTAGSNKISSISDAANATQGGFRAASGAFTYDNNGNQISNAAKGITSITYNHLNLPINITLSGSRTIDFTYTADGTKLRKVVKTGATINLVQEYVNGIEYRGTAIPATTIEGIYHAEGQLYNNAGTWRREYVIKDHLGDTRIAYCDNNNDGVIATPSEILQENNYDAFGYGLDGVYMNHSNPDNLYQYNGKEKNDDHGIGMYDYGARWYDCGLGRWTSKDPLADAYHNQSPYSYVNNNPITNTDPSGMSSENKSSTFVDPNGKVIEHRNDGDPLAYFVNNISGWNGSKDGLGILGFEDPSKSYKKGDLYQQFIPSQSTQGSHKGALAAAIKAGGMLAADDISGVGAVDDVLIPVVIGTAIVYVLLTEDAPIPISLPRTNDRDAMKVVFIDGSKSPEAAQHGFDAIMNGVTNFGILDRPGANNRRINNTKGFPILPGKDRDEFVPAVLIPSGRVSIRSITLGDNRSAGRQIGAQLAGVSNGAKVVVIPILKK